MSSPIMEVNHLQAGYQGHEILEDISFRVWPGEICIILGGSGCGKSTLLKNLIRLQEPSGGSVQFFGEEITGMDDREMEHVLSHLGVLFQNSALLNSFTVYDNLAIPLEQHTRLPLAIIGRMITTKLNLVGLGHAAHRFPSELSGGMRKRAGLARAIILDPRLLFCDEPSAGLDPITSYALDQLFLTLNRQLRMTIVIVTHELSSIYRLADHIVFLHQGHVLFDGNLENAVSSSIPEVHAFFSTR
ncbi:MAG: ATP-binding cassette domain-containing protein [Candidatus Delongbacteria bacterium]|nr:ATP-binding cassette domain-containing protein [Candidatus Delongbacteria bacterium]